MSVKTFKQRLKDVYSAVYNVATPVNNFLGGNFMAEGSKKRTAFVVATSPVRLSVNVIRTGVAGLLTFLSILPIAIYHAFTYKKQVIAVNKKEAATSAVVAGNLSKIDSSAQSHADQALVAAYRAQEAAKLGDANSVVAHAKTAKSHAAASTAVVYTKLNGVSKPANVDEMTAFRNKHLHPVKTAYNAYKANKAVKSTVEYQTAKEIQQAKDAKEAKLAKAAVAQEKAAKKAEVKLNGGMFKQAKGAFVSKLAGMVFNF